MAVGLLGCSQTLPPGDNFVSEGNPTLVLNLQAGQWQLIVDGVYRTDVTVTIDDGGIDKDGAVYELKLDGAAIPGMPKSLSLQQAFQGSIISTDFTCTGCSAPRSAWKRIRRE